jgi:predicted short-subunit dehydrogenase-like oxidoreductase (DUF2520 family)
VIAEAAAAVAPVPTTVVAHLAGSLGLDVLAGHPRVAALHPLVALPDAGTGADRLAAGAWFAVAGDPLVAQVVADLGGHSFSVADEDRTRYHAAAVIASNHLVALLGQVERVAPGGVPLVAFLDLVRGTVDNVEALGPAAALTGPVARGDWATVERHLAALPADERPAYEAMVALARRLVRCRSPRPSPRRGGPSTRCAGTGAPSAWSRRWATCTTATCPSWPRPGRPPTSWWPPSS